MCKDGLETLTIAHNRHIQDHDTTRFEIFVSKGFCELEVAAVTNTLSLANNILAKDKFDWRYVSDTPGLVSGANDMLVRAEPAIQDHGFCDIMVVVGGRKRSPEPWAQRARAMQRRALLVVLLSEAATSYIETTKSPTGKVTTHWRDAVILEETGYHPTLTYSLAENSNGIVTSAGGAATQELLIGLIAPACTGAQVAELGNRLLLQYIRNTDAEQPRDIAHNGGLFDQRITAAIQLMENTISDPLPMTDLTDQLGVSTRQLERQFREVFNDTPAKFYKRLRAKRARAMLQETLMPIIDVAVATGFGSSAMLAKAVKDEYGMTPTKMRERKTLDLIAFKDGS